MRTTSRCPCAMRRRISPSTASAARLREAPRTSGITQKLHENEQPSCILTNARTRSSRASAWTQPIAPTSPATNAASPRCCAATTDVLGQAREGVAGEVRAAAGDVDAAVRARPRGRPPCATLRDGLVRDAARVDDRDVARRARLDVTVARAARSRTSCASTWETLQPRNRRGRTPRRDRRRSRRRCTSAHQPSCVSARRPLVPARSGSSDEEVAGGDRQPAPRRGSAARAPRRARCSRRRHRMRAAARRASRSAPRGDAVPRRVLVRRLDRRLVDVDAEHRREAEHRRRDGEHAGAAADVEERAGLDVLQQLEAELGRRVRARAERASRVDDTASEPDGRLLPRRPDPEAAGLDAVVERAPASSQPASTSAPSPVPKKCQRRSSPAASAYAASSTPPRRSTSSKPCGNSSIIVARASSAFSWPTCTETRRRPISGTHSSACRRSPRRAGRCRRRSRPRTPAAAGAGRRSGAAARGR